MRKIWRTSPPSVETGPIWRALTTERQLVFDYWVCCPGCGGYQKVVFENIRWPEDLRAPLRTKAEQSAWYECVRYSSNWDDADRKYYPGSKKPIPGGIKLARFDTRYFKNQLAGILEIGAR
jgi:hypothetical protein